jgi:uncharacterized membrane protein YdjX (TVP38/TMEM64 family)
VPLTHYLSAIKKYRIVVITFSVQLFLMALFHVSFLAVTQEWLTKYGQNQSLLFWLFMFLCSIPLLSIGLMSSTFLALVAGYFLGWESFWYYIPSYIISAYVGYKIIAFIDRGKTLTALASSQRLVKVKNYLLQYPFFSVLFLRFSPVISFGQLTALCALVQLNTSNYIAASTLGMLPRTALAIWCGMEIKQRYGSISDYSLPEQYTPFVITLFMLSLLGILYTFKRSILNPKPLY